MKIIFIINIVFISLLIASLLIIDTFATLNPSKAVIASDIETVPAVYQKEVNLMDNSTTEVAIKQTITEFAVKQVTEDEVIYKKYDINVPLVQEDYYWGKHINASAAANEISLVSEISAGDKIKLIKDGYLTFDSSAGYIKPGNKYLYASGVCWTTSTLGLMMDTANADFKEKYGMDLFVFEYPGRSPHQSKYATYKNINNGYGYSVEESPTYTFDYTFQINPELQNHKLLKNLKVKIEMYSITDSTSGFNGEAIGAYLKTNIDI